MSAVALVCAILAFCGVISEHLALIICTVYLILHIAIE